MDISRKTFLRQLAFGAAALAVPRLAGAQNGSPVNTGAPFLRSAAGAPTSGGEEIRPALPAHPVAVSAAPVGPSITPAEIPFLSSGPGFGRRIALTFDDGPNPKVTERVLKTLAEHKIPATFFMIGERVEAAGDWAGAVAEAGHEIGNHSLTHPQLSKMSDERVAYEIERTQDLILAATNQIPAWFRPPYGAFRRTQGPIAAAHGVGVMFWSVDPRDWSQPGADKIAQVVLTETRPGSIVLMHDLHPQTADALPRIVEGLLERGYEFSTITEFLGNPYGGPPGTIPTLVPAA